MTKKDYMEIFNALSKAQATYKIRVEENMKFYDDKTKISPKSSRNQLASVLRAKRILRKNYLSSCNN